MSLRPAVRDKEVTLLSQSLNSGVIIGEPVDLKEVLGFSIWCQITDIPPATGSTGEFSLEASLNKEDWITIENSSFSLVATDDCFIEYKEPYFKWVRPKFELTTGEVFIECLFFAKVV